MSKVKPNFTCEGNFPEKYWLRFCQLLNCVPSDNEYYSRNFYAKSLALSLCEAKVADKGFEVFLVVVVRVFLFTCTNMDQRLQTFLVCWSLLNVTDLSLEEWVNGSVALRRSMTESLDIWKLVHSWYFEFGMFRHADEADVWVDKWFVFKFTGLQMSWLFFFCLYTILQKNKLMRWV